MHKSHQFGSSILLRGNLLSVPSHFTFILIYGFSSSPSLRDIRVSLVASVLVTSSPTSLGLCLGRENKQRRNTQDLDENKTKRER